MESKTIFCCILKVSLEERVIQRGGKSSELNQKEFLVLFCLQEISQIA